MKKIWSKIRPASKILEKFNRRDHTGNRGTIGMVYSMSVQRDLRHLKWNQLL